jgi:ATP-dependent DNA ligase
MSKDKKRFAVGTKVWIKMPGAHGVDSIIVGYYKESQLIYVARVRNGFVPATRRQVFAKLQPLVSSDCPFANLPETHKGRWGTGLTADDMKKCVWVRPNFVAQIEYLEWTESDHLRHALHSPKSQAR